MVKYGLTPQGINPKRLDTILEEMHEKMSTKLGVNTRLNRESLLNHLLTNVADQIAELWEFGESVYHSQYPASAEDISLDNAAQYGGITREMPAKSFYKILCTGVDGTVLPAGTLIASDTNPSIALSTTKEAVITRALFNKAVIVPASDGTSGEHSIAINGELFFSQTLEGFVDAMNDSEFLVSYDDGKLSIASPDEDSSNAMVLSGSLTTHTVSTVVMFGTNDDGDIFVPKGAITKIVRAVPGLMSIVNVGDYVAGRLIETDAEFRKSYIDKIYNRSSSMLESVKSAILDNVQGVLSVAPYENDTNVFDSMGRPPHSIEVVVDGGNTEEIATQILKTKAGGISTFGNVETILHGVYGEDITIRFNRPTYVNVWFRIGVTLDKDSNPPTNYAELIKEVIVECMEGVEAGDDVVPQRFMNELYKRIAGIDYFDIKLYKENNAVQPTEDDFTLRSVTVSERERAVTTENRIEVVIDG